MPSRKQALEEGGVDSFGDTKKAKELLTGILQTATLAELPPVALGLGILFVLLAAIYYSILPEQYRLTMVYFSAGTSVLMFLIAWRNKRSKFIIRYSHLTAFIMAGAVYINCLVLLILSDQVHWTSYITLLVIGGGFLILSTGYLVLLYVIIAYTWVAIATPHFFAAEARDWVYFGIVLLAAYIIGLVEHIVHVKLLKRSELLRLEAENKSVRLEESLENIRVQEEAFHDLFENATDLIQMVDGKGNYLYVNRKWKETLGYTDEEVRKVNLKDVVANDQIEHCQTILQELVKGPASFNIETKFLTKDRRTVMVEGNFNSRFEQGQFVSTRGIFRDMTKRYEDEARLKRLTSELDSLNKKLAQAYQEVRNEKDKLLELLNREEMVMLLDSKGQVLGISDKALGATGYTRTEILGKSVVDILDPASRLEVVTLLKNGLVGTYQSVKIQFLLTVADFRMYTMGFHRINMLKDRLILVIIREFLKE